MAEYSKLPFAFVNPGEVLAAGIALPLVCILFVGLRLYARRMQKQTIGTDDWMSLIAMFLTIGLGVCFIVGYAQGVMGYPTPLPVGVNAQDAYENYLTAYEKEAKIEFYFQQIMIAAYGFIKLSILFFYRRIFSVQAKSTFGIISMATIVIIIAWTLAFFFWFLFGCRTKIYLHWAPYAEVQDQCGNPLSPEIGLVVSDLATDLIILLLPLPIIWRLNLEWRRRLKILLVFLVGLIAIAASITRMAIYVIVSYTSVSDGYDVDQTVTTMLYWSMIEASLGLITSCLPILSIFLRTVRAPESLNRLLKKTGYSSSSSSWFGKRSKASDTSGKASEDPQMLNTLDFGTTIRASKFLATRDPQVTNAGASTESLQHMV